MDHKAVGEQYYELVDDKSSKFWAITLFDQSHTVRYGKIGAVGRNQSKRFDRAEGARLDAERLVSSKLKKGYSRVANPMTTAVSGHEPAGALEMAYSDADGLRLVRRHYPSGHLAEVSYFGLDGRAGKQCWFIDRDEDWKPLIRPWVLLNLDRLSPRAVRIEKIVGHYPISYRVYDEAGKQL